jgi:hypothetical protein
VATSTALDEIEHTLGNGPGSEPRFAIARQSCARALARVRLLEAWLEDRGLLDSKGRPRPSTRLLADAHSALLLHLQALGMTPISAARLGLDLTRQIDLATELVRAQRNGSR